MQNPINYIADNPNNIFEKAKSAIGEKASQFLQSDTGQSVVEKAAPALSVMEKIAVPYRDVVAPALSAVLLELNSNYRAQNKGMSVADQTAHAFDLAKAPVEGKQDWQRSISPGRALVGLMGNLNFRGDSGTEKINWSNSAEVDKFFTSGSAQFWSGAADLGFNLLDPVAIAGGKVTSISRKAYLTRPVGSRFGRVDKLSAEIDEAVANPKSNTAAAQIFKLVEKDPENIRVIQATGLAATSTNPAQYAVMLSDAYKSGGRTKMGEVIKASVGNVDVLNKLKKEDASLHAMLMDNANQKATVQREIEDLKSALATKKDYTPEEVNIMQANKEALGQKLDQIDEEATQAAIKKQALEPLMNQEFRSTQTWARSSYVERVRTALADAKMDGTLIETDAGKNISYAKQVAKGLGTKTPYVRAVMWLSPNQQLREHPSGLAFTGGAAGELSHKEFDARLSTMGRLFGMSKKDMIDASNNYRRTTSKSERFTAFENLQHQAFKMMIEKHYGKKLGELSAEQSDAMDAIVRGLADSTKRAQRREMNRMIDRNYTVTDIGQNHVAYKYLDEIKKTAATERAMELRGSTTPTKDDYRAVEIALRNNQLTATQVPYIHFGVDMQFFDRVMAENPKLIGNLVDKITQDGWDASQVSAALRKSEESAMLDNSPVSAEDIAALTRKATDHVIDGIDTFYTYVWKPFTLLSFKYTSRNVVEGYLRVAASMVDFASYYGYGYTEMFKGFRNPGAIARSFENRGFRKSSKKARAEYAAKVEEIKVKEDIVRKQFRTPYGDGYKAAQGSKKQLLDGIDKETFVANDSVAMTLMFTKNQLRSIKNYKSSGNANADAIAKTLNEDLATALSASSEAYGSPSGTAFVRLLAEGDYNEASKLSKQANPRDLIFAIQQYRDEVDQAYSKIMDLDAGSANLVDHVLENARFAIGRFFVHADDTIKTLGNKALLQNELIDISAKGKIRKSYSGMQQREIYPGVYVDASFAGDAGEMLRNATSSHVSTTRTLADERRVSAYGMMSGGSLRTSIERHSPEWTAAHAEYVNNIIMKDVLMRHMVENMAEGMTPGESAAEALNWLRTSSDKELNLWKREVKGNMSGLQDAMSAQFDYEQQVKTSLLQIESYLPSASENPAVSYEGLYKRAVDGFTEEDSARIAFEDRISVTTSADRKEVDLFRFYRNGVSNVFKMIGTLPEDTLVRHPFFNMVHDAEMSRIVKQYEKYGKKKNLSNEQIRALIADNKDRIKTAGVNRAYKELMQRLYSVERYTSPGRLLRWVAPFYMAHQNTSRFWLGVSIRNPQVAWNMAKLYNAPFRAGLVYDENGNQVKEGNPWQADANKQRITLETPQWLRGAIGKDELVTSPSGFDVVTQGQMFVIPTLGGFVGEIAGQELIKAAAKNSNADTFLREKFGVSLDEFSQKYILPFYDKTYGESIASNIVNSAVPFNSATISGLAYVYGSTGHLPFGGTLVNGTLDLIPAIKGRYEQRYAAAREQITVERLMNNESLDEKTLSEEAAKLAATSLKAEAVLKFSPTIAAFQPVDKNMNELNALLTKLQSADYNAGGVAFIKELENRGVYNAPGIMSTLRASTVNNKFGLNANIATIKGVQTNIDSFSHAAYYYQDSPFLGELFNQSYDKNPYSKTADELMYSTTVNDSPLKSRNMTPAEADHKAQMDAAWQEYFTNIKYIEEDAKARNISQDSKTYADYYKPWKERLVEHIGKKFPAFDTKEVTITLHKSDRYIALAQYFLQDKKFMSTVGKDNEAIAGLKYYMEGRQVILDELTLQREATGTYGLDTKTNHAYFLWKERFAEDAIAKYPAFKQMYERYLSKDEFNVVDSTLKGLE